MNTGIVLKKNKKKSSESPPFVTVDSSGLSSEQTAFFKLIPL